MVQLSKDCEECLFMGPEEIERYFLSKEGLKITDVDAIVRERMGS